MFGFDLDVPFLRESGDNEPAWELVVTPAVVRQLRAALLQTDELERTAFVRCFPSGSRLLSAEVEPISDSEMIRQGRTECRPQLDVERRAIHDAVDAGGVVFHVHSHPFTDIAGFSSADRRIMPKLTRWVEQTYGDDGTIVFGVLGRQNLQVTQYDLESETFTTIPVSVLGSWALDTPLEGATPFAATGPSVDHEDPIADRFDRNLRAFGAAGQRRLREATVTVVGVGGLGSGIAEQLARIGVGTINLVDPDHLEATNLPRVYGAYAPDVGTPKVETLRLHLSRIDPALTVTTHESVVEADEVADTLVTSDAVIAGLDRMSSRSFLNQFCVRHGIPYVDAGVAISTAAGDDADELDVTSMDGFVQTVVPGTTACFDCLDRIDPAQTRLERLPDEDLETEQAEGYVDGTELTPEPAVVSLNTTVAGMAVSEFVNLVTGVRPPRGFIHYEALDQSVSQLDAQQSRNKECRTCGHEQLLFRGETSQMAATDLAETIDTDLDSIPSPPDPSAEESMSATDTAELNADSDAVKTDQSTDDGGSASAADQSGPAPRENGQPFSTLFQYLQEEILWKR